jgi:hypothetical protein
MENKKTVAENLRNRRTPAGRYVVAWISQKRPENSAYRAVEDLFERVTGQAFSLYPQDDKEDALIEQTISSLLTKFGTPGQFQKVFGSAQPGMFGLNGEQLFVEPMRSFGELVSSADDNEDGFSGFLKDCGLPLDTSRKVVIGCATLLDLDVALEQIESGQCWRVSWTIYGAAESAQEIQEIIIDESLREERRKKASGAGKAAHKDTNEFKKEVLKEWAEGKFKNAAACARWACRQFPIEATETPLRWIREYKKSLPT